MKPPMFGLGTVDFFYTYWDIGKIIGSSKERETGFLLCFNIPSNRYGFLHRTSAWVQDASESIHRLSLCWSFSSSPWVQQSPSLSSLTPSGTFFLPLSVQPTTHDINEGIESTSISKVGNNNSSSKGIECPVVAKWEYEQYITGDRTSTEKQLGKTKHDRGDSSSLERQTLACTEELQCQHTWGSRCFHKPLCTYPPL